MRNELISKQAVLCEVAYKQFRLFRSIAESANSMKDALEPFRLIGAARCASGGRLTHKLDTLTCSLSLSFKAFLKAA
jgi:hypothetical protein